MRSGPSGHTEEGSSTEGGTSPDDELVLRMATSTESESDIPSADTGEFPEAASSVNTTPTFEARRYTTDTSRVLEKATPGGGVIRVKPRIWEPYQLRKRRPCRICGQMHPVYAACPTHWSPRCGGGSSVA